ncbi:MAG: FeoA family protein [Planctomycetota bacterium]
MTADPPDCPLDPVRPGGAGAPDGALDACGAVFVRVVSVEGSDALSERLSSAGLWPGAVVERLASAPFGGPMLFRVQGYRLALLRSEAARVRVQTISGVAG